MSIQNIESNSVYLGRNVKDEWEYDEWTVTLFYKGRQENFDYMMGTGFNGEEPEVESVLESLFLDSNAEDMGFEEWCYEFGMNSDSIKDSKVYDKCVENTEKLKNLLGNDYDVIQNEIEVIMHG